MAGLHELVDRYCESKLGRPVDLSNPRSYNDKINWLKLYDQMPEHVQCCDKLAVRDFVRDHYGSEILLRVFEQRDHFGHLQPRWPCAVKCNHDSGSVAVIRKQSEWAKAEPKISRGLGRTFGVRAGEWAYARIVPKCFSEEFFPGGAVDFKFHCCEGRVKWVQIIAERHTGQPVEYITDAAGRLLGLHLDHQFRHGTDLPKLCNEWCWTRMLEVACVLSAPFRYVRVDLYAHGKRDVRFGELTFWPKAGCYKTPDEPAFGGLLDFDTSYKREPIVC